MAARRRMKRLCLALLMPCLVGPVVAGELKLVEPQLRIGETVDYYDVTARDPAELIEIMRVPGVDGKFRQAHGLTRASFTIERKLTQKPGQCSIDSLGIRLTLQLTLPRWAPGVDIPPGLRKQWDALRERIVTHENRHRQHALDAAFAMRDRFAEIEPAAQCPKVEAMLQRVLGAALLQQQLADQFLDQRQMPSAQGLVEDEARKRERALPLRGR